MDSAQTQKGASSSGLLGWRRRTAARLIAGLGASIAAVISLAYASYTLSRPADMPRVAAGQTIDTGRWRVALLNARLAKANPDASFYLDRRDTLQVDMQFTNLSQESSNSYPRVAQLDPKPGAFGDPVFKLARDGSISGSLHPNMAEYVTAYWALPDGGTAPREMRFLVNGERFKPRDNLYGAPGWFPADSVALVTLPVKAQP